MSETTGAGSKIYIGPANSTANTEQEFEGLAYVEIGKVVNIGGFGISYQAVTSDQLGDRLTKTAKGQKSAGSPTVVYDYDPADEGQQDVAAALGSDSDYAFKIELGDAGDESPSAPTTYYFRARVMANPLADIQPNDMIRRNLVIGINSVPIEVPAI